MVSVPFDAQAPSPCLRDLQNVGPHGLQLLGMDHSPWAQTVAIALRLKNLPFTTTIIFPLRKFCSSGFIFPVLYADGETLTGSEAALRFIDKFGASEAGPVGSLTNVYDEPDWLFRAEELMYLLLCGRCPPLHFGGFVNSCSRMTDVCESHSKCLVNAFMRGLPCLHFGLTVALATAALWLQLDLSKTRANLRW